MYVCIYIYTYALGSRAPTPPPPWYPRPPQRSRTTGTNPLKQEGGRTIETDPSQCFFTGAENRIRAGTGAPFARRKEQHHILYGNEHVTMTLLLTRQQPYHTSVEHTAPHRRGQPKTPQAPLHREEGTRPKKTRRLDRQGGDGYHGVGGEWGCSSPASYVWMCGYIYIYMYMYIYLCMCVYICIYNSYIRTQLHRLSFWVILCQPALCPVQSLLFLLFLELVSFLARCLTALLT